MQTNEIISSQVKVWFQNRRTKHKRVLPEDGKDTGDDDNDNEKEAQDLEDIYDKSEDEDVDSDDGRRENKFKNAEHLGTCERRETSGSDEDVMSKDGEPMADESEYVNVDDRYSSCSSSSSLRGRGDRSKPHRGNTSQSRPINVRREEDVVVDDDDSNYTGDVREGVVYDDVITTSSHVQPMSGQVRDFRSIPDHHSYRNVII